MREVRSASDELRHGEGTCPECGHEFDADGG
jgi:transposase